MNAIYRIDYISIFLLKKEIIKLASQKVKIQGQKQIFSDLIPVIHRKTSGGTGIHRGSSKVKGSSVLWFVAELDCTVMLVSLNICWLLSLGKEMHNYVFSFKNVIMLASSHI